MKKILFMLAVLFCTAGAFAQVNCVTGNSKLTDGISVGVETGVSGPLSSEAFSAANPHLGIFVEKEISPLFSLGIEGQMAKRGFEGNDWAVASWQVMGNLGMNLTNAIKGIPAKPYTIEYGPTVGFGYKSYDNRAGHVNAFIMNTGANIDLNLFKSQPLTLRINPGVDWNFTKANCKFNRNYANYNMNVGVIYHLKNSNGKRYTSTVTHYGQSDIDALSKRIDGLRDTIQTLNNKPAEIKVVKKVIEKPVYLDRTTVVTFAKNSYELSPVAQETLSMFVKSGVKKAKIVAYASPEGGKDYNIQLSKNRANAVAKFLKDHCVEVVGQEGLGANSKESNRIAIVVAQ